MAWESEEENSRGFQAKIAVTARGVFFRNAALGGCSGSSRWFHTYAYGGAANGLDGDGGGVG